MLKYPHEPSWGTLGVAAVVMDDGGRRVRVEVPRFGAAGFAA
ncbi:hypothetical protein ACIQF8_18040 [Pseudarthrobacter sp. NPDC092184]